MNKANTIYEAARDVPVVEECDVCVVGGSCTGVFAAIRAARMGARVALIEGHGFFGGTATAGLVSVWHSLFDTEGKKQIIAGLTDEVIEKMCARGMARKFEPENPHKYVSFNAAELILTLDEAALAEKNIRSFLHARVVSVAKEGDVVGAVIVENASGRQAVRAKVFIDATGNGDLAHHAGLAMYNYPHRLPPTMCALYSGVGAARAKQPEFHPDRVVFDPKNPKALPQGFLWYADIPGLQDIVMVAGTRVSQVDTCDADQLTFAEFEGRRQVRRSLEMMNEHAGGEGIRLVALPSHIGVRDTRHAHCHYQLTERDVLEGVAFDDTIAHGSYRVDVHFDDKPGLVFRYLDGREDIVNPPLPSVCGRWREERAVNPTFYNIPFRSILPRGLDNVLVVGRALDADRGAFGAARVMVNLNQTGEAAGVAAALAVENNCALSALDIPSLQAAMRKGGSILHV
jgi:Dehydrogenases (flavoproteins)